MLLHTSMVLRKMVARAPGICVIMTSVESWRDYLASPLHS
jgi:hypothetical protein